MFDVAIWGTVANWVSGIATSCAATIALTVASLNARNVRKDKEAAGKREAEVENAMLVQVLFLYRDLSRAAQGLLNQLGSPDGVSLEEFRFIFADVRATALRLQQLPAVNLRAFQELERVVQLSRYADEINMIAWEDVETLMGSILYQCEHANQTIQETPNRLAPLNW